MVARCAGYDCYPAAIFSGGDGSGCCGMVVTYCGLVVVLVMVSVVFMTNCCSFVAASDCYLFHMVCWYGGVLIVAIVAGY